jgi:hypothetical protein
MEDLWNIIVYVILFGIVGAVILFIAQIGENGRPFLMIILLLLFVAFCHYLIS